MKTNSIALAIATLFSFAFMITLNALANILPINGYNTGQLSDMYPNLFVPAGITFAIWGLIYSQLLIFTLYLTYNLIKNKETTSKKVILYSLSCLANALWIVAWHYRLVFLSLIIMLALLALLIKLYHLPRPSNTKGKVMESSAISVYIGWISVATIANTTALLVNLGWKGAPFSEVTWTVIMVIVASILSSLFIIKEKDVIYPLVTIWALYGITIKRLAANPPEMAIVYACYGCMLSLVALIAYSIAKKRTYFHV